MRAVVNPIRNAKMTYFYHFFWTAFAIRVPIVCDFLRLFDRCFELTATSSVLLHHIGPLDRGDNYSNATSLIIDRSLTLLLKVL